MSAPPVGGRIDVRREWPHAFVSHRSATMRSGQKKTTSTRLVVRKCVRRTGWLRETIRPGGALRSDLSWVLELPFLAPPFWQRTHYSATPRAAPATDLTSCSRCRSIHQGAATSRIGRWLEPCRRPHGPSDFGLDIEDPSSRRSWPGRCHTAWAIMMRCVLQHASAGPRWSRRADREDAASGARPGPAAKPRAGDRLPESLYRDECHQTRWKWIVNHVPGARRIQ